MKTKMYSNPSRKPMMYGGMTEKKEMAMGGKAYSNATSKPMMYGGMAGKK